VFAKSGESTFPEDSGELSRRRVVAKEKGQAVICVGDQMKCPKCGTLGRVVWISQSKKTIGIKCQASHRDIDSLQLKYGPRAISSAKRWKNAVFITAIEQ